MDESCGGKRQQAKILMQTNKPQEEKRRYQQKYDKTRCSECGRRQTVVRSIEDGASGELFDSSPNDMSDIFAQTSCMDPLSDRTCEAPGYQDQATVEDALALSSVDSPATSLYGRNDLSYLVESQEAIWTLCALLLPIGNGSNPLRYYMIHVLGIMDTISQETVSFTLTGETIYRLAEYHDTVCINVAQKQKFLRSIHAYRYFAGHDEVLDAIESDGNGEFKGEQSDAVKKDILNFLDMLD